MASKAELVKTQILATGLSKNIKGFTLLELLVVLLIIDIASSVILVNNSSINNIINEELKRVVLDRLSSAKINISSQDNNE